MLFHIQRFHETIQFNGVQVAIRDGASPAFSAGLEPGTEGLQGIAFRDEDGPQVQDDHIALNRVGIPTIDLIDFDYPHWHKLSDTPDKCSGATMATVAKVLTTWIQRIK